MLWQFRPSGTIRSHIQTTPLQPGSPRDEPLLEESFAAFVFSVLPYATVEKTLTFPPTLFLTFVSGSDTRHNRARDNFTNNPVKEERFFQPEKRLGCQAFRQKKDQSDYEPWPAAANE